MLFTAILLSFGLVACQDSADPVEGTKEVSDLTAEEVYEKTLKASEDMKSAEMVMDLTQKIEVPSENVAMDTTTKTDAKMTMDPLTMYQKGKVKMEMEGTPMEMDIEMYMTEDGMYMFDSESETWLEMGDMIPDELLNQQQDPAEQVKMIEKFVDNLEFKQTDDAYVLELTADGDKFKELTEDLMNQFMPEELMTEIENAEENPLEDMEINKLYYELHVDKESYDLKSFNMEMDMALKNDEGEMNISQKAEAEYKNINGVDTIEVPQEVIDKAESLF